MSKRIGIIDYGVGNIRSVYHAVNAVGGEAHLVSDPGGIADMDALILPGVGAFGHTAAAFAASRLKAPTLDAVDRGVPLLGICVGMQLLFEESHEFGVTPGLGLLGGAVRKIEPQHRSNWRPRLPVIGWFRTADLPEHRRGYYFLHSFAAVPTDSSDIHQTYEYEGTTVTASVIRGTVMGTQYHPERSAADGLEVLGRFVVSGSIAEA